MVRVGTYVGPSDVPESAAREIARAGIIPGVERDPPWKRAILRDLASEVAKG